MSVSALWLHGLNPLHRCTNFVTKGSPTEMRSISTTSFTKSGGVNAKPFPLWRGDSQERRVGFDEVEYRLVRPARSGKRINRKRRRCFLPFAAKTPFSSLLPPQAVPLPLRGRLVEAFVWLKAVKFVQFRRQEQAPALQWSMLFRA